MWGTGASSTQCEGAAPASDWLAWENAGRAPRSGDGNGFAHRYAEDFALLASLGLTHHRISIEWARIEPEPGVHDQAAVEHYLAVLSAARAAGVEPWVCLHHFTAPALVRRGRRVPRRVQPHRRLGTTCRLHRRDVRRAGRRLEAGQRDELLRPSRLPGRRMATGASTTVSRRRSWTKQSTSPPPRQRSRSARPVNRWRRSMGCPRSSCTTTTTPHSAKPTACTTSTGRPGSVCSATAS